MNEPVSQVVAHGCSAGSDHDRDVPEIDLLSALTLRGITLRNRIVMSPMCQYSAEEGLANDWHLVHLGSRAVGGVALVMVEATAITRELLREPYWALKAQHELGAGPSWPAPYGYAVKRRAK